MFRYIALVWNVSDEQQSRTAESLDARLRARQWTPVFVAKGLRAFCADRAAEHSVRSRSQTMPASSWARCSSAIATSMTIRRRVAPL